MPKPPDVPVCKKLKGFLGTNPTNGHIEYRPSPTCMKAIGEPECGRCSYLMSDKVIFIGEKPEHYYNKKPWSQLEREAILVPAEESYAPMMTYVINACEKNKCSKEVQRFKVKLDSLDSVGTVVKQSKKDKKKEGSK